MVFNIPVISDCGHGVHSFVAGLNGLFVPHATHSHPFSDVAGCELYT